MTVLSPLVQGQNQQGIYVGKPKVFDSRTLNLMLEDLSAQLGRITVLDQTKLAAAMGTLQGMESRETATSTTIGLTKPFMKASVDANNKTTLTETVPDAKYPANTDLGTMGTLGSTDLKYGMASQDLLGDQVNLQYQIFNLRMIMDRSLTDRIQGNGTKLQAVLGIPVSIIPSRSALDSAAMVKVTVSQKGSEDPVSVVALMPQEKTYNSAALSRSSNSFGASAVAKVVQVGFSATKRGQTYFLYRDNDTLSFEYPNNEKKSVFGWQFRPVLGRRSVAPGMRQMFAVVALPAKDSFGKDIPIEYNLEIKVETSWVKYQRSQLTTYPTTLWYEALGRIVGKPSTPPKPDDAVCYLVRVPTTGAFQETLAPEITDVGWTWVGNKDVIVSVEGRNFFSDTKVLMNGKAFDSSTGLKLKSEQAFDLVVDGASLNDAVIQGRYGAAKPLLRPQNEELLPLEIAKVAWEPPIDGFSTVEVYLKWPNADFETKNLPRLSVKSEARASKPDDLLEPQITLNDTLLGGRVDKLDVLPAGEKNKQVILRLSVSADIVKKASGVLTVRYPFLGSRWVASYPVRDKNQTYSLTRLQSISVEKELSAPAKKNVPAKQQEADAASDAKPVEWTFLALTDRQNILDETPDLTVLIVNGKTIRLEKQGEGKCAVTEPKDWTESFCMQAKDLAIVRLKTSDLGDELLLTRTGVILRTAVPPKEKKEEPAKKLPQINQYDSVWFTIDFAKAKVASVKADGEALETRPTDAKGEKTDVLVTRKLTAKPGFLDLIVYEPTSKDGKADTLGKTVRVEIVCRECGKKER
jgi:hypothetical protein